ncbi:MAG: tetratricopeptide repeat protein [Betaproteobacteria bacterium]|nr:MAG: tetratricopeptide repeat protein [Betaproteobacteria bacterium]
MSSPTAGTALAGLERLLAAGKDGALLRFGLGSEYLKLGNAEAAAMHLQRAVELDPTYSAAWKMLGKALASAHRDEDALAAWREGIAAAERKGDKQAMREMQVFARRLAKQGGQE